ncbi:MAG: hypothetical protein GWO24_34440, partial [Akkermansiaceae bacterium]|nr:hypothetical protein [Akkermansiaceae bacterium]
PLTTRSQLRAEGRAQSNCVASYSRRVKNGALYVYRVLWPERCTLSLVKRRNGLWVLGELKTAHNSRASAKTR